MLIRDHLLKYSKKVTYTELGVPRATVVHILVPFCFLMYPTMTSSSSPPQKVPHPPHPIGLIRQQACGFPSWFDCNLMIRSIPFRVCRRWARLLAIGFRTCLLSGSSAIFSLWPSLHNSSLIMSSFFCMFKSSPWMEPLKIPFILLGSLWFRLCVEVDFDYLPDRIIMIG